MKYKQKSFSHINSAIFTSNIILRRKSGVGNTTIQIKHLEWGRNL